MWTKIAGIILRNRIILLSLVVLVTVFMFLQARKAQMSYELAQMLPNDDTTFVEHTRFKELFSEEANIFAIGIQDTAFFTLSHFQNWQNLTQEIKKIDGVIDVVSISELIKLKKNKAKRAFDIESIFPKKINTQEELDSLYQNLLNFPVYNGLIYNDTSSIYAMTISIDKHKLNTSNRIKIVENIENVAQGFSKRTGLKLHYSGLPYIRTAVTKKMQHEISMFILLAILVVVVMLFLLFKSYKAVLVSLSIVAIAVIWTFATIAIFDFKITILTGMLPPLLIVIGIPNSIFLINKYISDYQSHRGKMRAIQRVIQKTGSAIFLTNLTTAAGFGTFILTSSEILREFGIVAAINILGIFVLSLLIIPIVYSFLPPPKATHTKHIDGKYVQIFIKKLTFLTENHRTYIYIATVLLVLIGLYGTSRMETTGYLVDDIPVEDPIYKDLKFFEHNFGGIMPFEIMIDTHKKKGALKLSTLKKIDKLQKKLKKFPELSEPISMVNGIKLAKQAFYHNKKSFYKLPTNQEKNFIFSYLMHSSKGNKKQFLHSFIDSLDQVTRVSYKVKDLGTYKMQELKNKVKAISDSIFSPEKYSVSITGTSIVFTKGTHYLIQNLFTSLALAIVMIAFFMALMFRSAKMVLISLIPNLIPLLLTAGIMGYFHIPIKPSTILIFSVAFGISVDDTIHFLAKYRQELKIFDWAIKRSVQETIKETGVSMLYTSIVLFLGLSIFTASDFGGTVALGLLVSITLLFAMFTNLILLPSFLLTLDKRLTTKAFEEPLLSIFDEEEDLELDDLEIKTIKQNE